MWFGLRQFGTDHVTPHFVAWTIMSLSSCFLARVALYTFKVQFVAVTQCDEYIRSFLANQKDRPKSSVSNCWYVLGSHPRAAYHPERVLKGTMLMFKAITPLFLSLTPLFLSLTPIFLSLTPLFLSLTPSLLTIKLSWTDSWDVFSGERAWTLIGYTHDNKVEMKIIKKRLASRVSAAGFLSICLMDNKLEFDVLIHIGYILSHVEGAGCSSMVARLLKVWWVVGSILHDRPWVSSPSTQCSTTVVTKAVAYNSLSVSWRIWTILYC